MIEILLALILALSGDGLCEVGTDMPEDEARLFATVTHPQADAIIAVRGEVEVFIFHDDEIGHVFLYFTGAPDEEGRVVRQFECARIIDAEGTDA